MSVFGRGRAGAAAAAPLQPLYDMLRTELADALPRMRPVENEIIELVRPDPIGRRYEVPVWVLADGRERYLVILPNSFGRQPGAVRATIGR